MAIASCQSSGSRGRNLSEQELAERRAARYEGLTFDIHQSAHETNYDVSHFYTGDQHDTRFIVVPGAPSQHRYWAGFAKRMPISADVFAIERPGYGTSNINGPVTSFDEQIQAITPLLLKKPEQCNLLIGSSYGAAIALKTALDFPDDVDGVMIVAGWIDAPAKKVSLWKSLSPLWSGLSHDEEWDTVRAELKDADLQRQAVIAQLGNLNIPVVIVHGDKDKLIPYKNAEILRNKIGSDKPVEIITVKGGDHYPQWSGRKELNEAVIKLSEKVEQIGRCG